MIRIALVGNPNSGKTTLFNHLSGRMESVGNWPGVTVARKEGLVKKSLSESSVRLIDLPGTYSMSPFTLEENVTLDYIRKERPDAIINIVDATALSRSLFLTTQLLQLGVPVIIALNKWDQALSKRIAVDALKLSEALGCPVVKTSSTSGAGLKALIRIAVDQKGKTQTAPFDPLGFDQITQENLPELNRQRYAFVESVVSTIEIRTIPSTAQSIHDAIDRVVANKWFGLPIFALILYTVFYLSQNFLGPFLAELLVSWIDSFGAFVASWMSSMDVSPLLQTIVLDGVIGGLGAIVGFLPLIMVLFFLLALLEDSGYMARVALVMDPLMKKVGLSGRSIIPMVIATGCAIPGIMSTRTIRDERQRKTSAMLSSLMPCGAKVPVIALFAGLFFKDQPWVGTSMYLLSILLIFVGALLIRKINGVGPGKSYFILELPSYRWPSLKRAWFAMLNQGKAFLMKAFTIILFSNILVQVMQSFTWSFNVVGPAQQASSILATSAAPLAVLLVPLGFGAWQFAAAAFTGFVAKENVVGTLAVVFGVTQFTQATDLGLTSAAALAFLMFNLYTPPCFAAIGAMNAELESKNWLLGALGFQIGLGYTIAYLVYQGGTLLTLGHPGEATLIGLLPILSFIGIILVLIRKNAPSAQKELV